MHRQPTPRASLTSLCLAIVAGVLFALAFASPAAAAKSCQLCNDKGYCLSFEDKGSCQANKLVVEKKWDATLKWNCSCSHKKTKSEPDTAACCWVAGTPLNKICGSESKVRRTLVVSNPGKIIECAPP